MSVTDIVFGWLGYDLWSEGNDEASEKGSTSKENNDNWIWVDRDGDRISQDDLEFFEKKQRRGPPLLSYAEAVKASFERCKPENGEIKRSKDDGISAEVNKNLVDEEIITKGNADGGVNERVPMKMKADRKRKSSGRFQPFPKHPKISYLENRNITNYVLERRIVPRSSRRIVCQSIKELNAEIPTVKSQYVSHWITVGKKQCTFKPVCRPRVLKMRLVVDVSDNHRIHVLRTCALRNNVESQGSAKLKDLYTIVDDIKQPRKTYAVKESAKKLNLACVNRVKTAFEEKKKPGKSSNHIISSGKGRTPTDSTDPLCTKGLTKFAIESKILALQYLLGVIKQPLSIELPQVKIAEDSSDNIFEGLNFIEEIFSGIINFAFSLSQMEVGYVEDFRMVPFFSSEIEDDLADRKEAAFKSSSTPRTTRHRKRRHRAEGYKDPNHKIHSKDDKKRELFKPLHKNRNNRKRKSRNFTPQKFSGRGGNRGW